MSDEQDFFFDEEEKPAEKAADKTEKTRSARTAPAKAPAAPATSAVAQSVQSVSVTVAALIGVVALLAGVIVGILIPAGGSNVPAPTSTAGSMSGIQAPQLTEEQLNSGQLPEGHPPVAGATGTAEASAAPESAPATAAE